MCHIGFVTMRILSLLLCDLCDHQPSFCHKCPEETCLISEATWICSFCFALHYTQVEKWDTTLKLLLLGMPHKCTLHTVVLSCENLIFSFHGNVRSSWAFPCQGTGILLSRGSPQS